LDTHGDSDEQNRRHDTDETNAAEERNFVEGLNRGERECPNHRHHDPCHGTCRMNGDSIKGDGDGDKSRSSKENHE
jgi:hypothetical protein